MTTRRNTLRAFGAFAATSAVGYAGLRSALTTQPAYAATTYAVTHTTEEWKKLLTPAQFDVLRRAGTERPYSSPLNEEKREGTFACAGCALPVYSSKTKFESHTGWPSFSAPLPDAIDKVEDKTLFMTRTEVLCHRCGGHLGHVFDDGPKPTGLRYCMNGVAMTFAPGPAAG